MEKLKEEKKKEQERGVDRWLLHKILLYHLVIFSLLDKICFTYVMQMTFVPDLISLSESVASFNQVVRI